MRKINFNLGAWVLSCLGAMVIVFSIIVSVPAVSKAFFAEATAKCKTGGDQTCSGAGSCVEYELVGCKCSGQEPKLCEGVPAWPY